MKKLISLLFSTVISFSLIAQEGDKEPYQVQNFNGSLATWRLKHPAGISQSKAGNPEMLKWKCIYVRKL